MVVLSLLSRRIHRWMGPALLRQGINLRYSISGGIIRDNPSLDSFFLLPVAQKMLSLEIHDATYPTSWSVMGKEKAAREGLQVTSKERIAIMEGFVRPALVPLETWSNVSQWQFQNRMLKWCRTEYLIAKYGSSFELKRESSQSLPTSAQIQETFGMQKWQARKSRKRFHKMAQIAERLGGYAVQVRGGAMVSAVVEDDSTSVSDLGFEELLEVAGGLVSTAGSWNAFCEIHDIYQLWSKEYIEGLGSYLQQRVASFSGETILLDVGAGDGLLTEALSEYFQKRRRRRRQSRAPTIVATDDGSWNISHKSAVEGLSVEEALNKYASETTTKQVIVMCSWMPMGEDWSQLFRDKGVHEYILIGEADDGQCGCNWRTWGNPCFDPEMEGDLLQPVAWSAGDIQNGVSVKPPVSRKDVPFEADGYARRELKHLLQYQFSRFDCRMSKTGTTVAFRYGE